MQQEGGKQQNLKLQLTSSVKTMSLKKLKLLVAEYGVEDVQPVSKVDFVAFSSTLY